MMFNLNFIIPSEPYVLVTATSFTSAGFEGALITFYKRLNQCRRLPHNIKTCLYQYHINT